MSAFSADQPAERLALWRARPLAATIRRAVLKRPELLAVMALAGVLNLWSLGVNGWANTYYSAAVRSMSTSWHDFLFVSLDRTGLMTIDKPPLSLWVQALSARVFGFHPMSVLIPQALMGVVAVALLYDLVARRFGRAAGFAGALALATTPVIVGVSRHNNPDELLVALSVAALWAATRAFANGRTRWFVAAGVLAGLAFETKMLVALFVVPGIAVAWLWVAPHGRLRALRQLLAGGAALAVVGGAWPVLVWLTPAADRPWISGTSDNSIWSLIFGYNGVGRVAGQAGGPQILGGGAGAAGRFAGGGAGAGGGPGGSLFGGPTGIFRMLQSGLGDQAGWLLGAALAAGLGLVLLTRLRRQDPRTAWVLAVGGAALTTAVVFSSASGIFHPYYVSLLAPFVAALFGAGVGEALGADGRTRWLGPMLLVGGVASELVVLGNMSGALSWATPVIAVAGGGAALTLALRLSTRARSGVLALGLAALLAAPATWAAETVGHRESGTFPAGGSAASPAGGPSGAAGRSGSFASPPGALGAPGGFGPPAGFGAPPGGFGAPPGGFGGPGGPGSGGTARGFGGGFGGPGDDSASLTTAIRYARTHGGGTIGVESQSSAATAILSSSADVAGLGGFSGRESSVSRSWLGGEIAAGRLRWVVVSSNGAGAQNDTRSGSRTAFSAVASSCRAVTLEQTNGGGRLFDCAGRAAQVSKG